ncbi:hypothetical protein EV360DRAFT_92097 [Lentinula raphanica]|nr:hypothetical protein EV360DRAFT_92097 [Lentinula raphanica]
MSSKVKRTYASRSNLLKAESSSTFLLANSTVLPLKRKQPFNEIHSQIAPSAKRLKVSKPKLQQKNLKQLHFCIDQSIVRTCKVCKLTYTKGAEDDEALHRAHCARVQRGMEWGKEEEREKDSAGVREIPGRVKLKDGKKGRIVCVDATATGKIGTKLSALLDTINITLSASTLSSKALRASKAYLFLLPGITPNKEKIVGCIIAQRIEKAMAVAASPQSSDPESDSDAASSRPLVNVDDSSGLFCYPELLPTALGVSRIFVTSAQRRQGIASSLLAAAARTFVHGCVLDPAEGQIAFSQTTGDGIALMRQWGHGGIRIYDEDDC